MITVYVVSSERAAGKTALSAGLARRWLGEGKRVGFLRPATAAGGNGACDAAFMKQVLGLTDPVDSLCPAIMDTPADRIKQAFAAVSAGKDIVIVEGQLGASSNDKLSQGAYQIAAVLNARVIGVETYPGASVPTASYQGFGKGLVGVVVNKVPQSRLSSVAEIRSLYAAGGINMLGALPEDRLLFAPTIGELADGIQGKVLSDAAKSADLVENLLVGALSIDSGLLYFGRKAAKAAIIRVDRPDMQLAALETPTKCLILSGSGEIYYRVVDKAAAKGVPIVRAESDTNTIVARIEAVIVKARFAQAKKLPRLTEVLQQSVDLKTLYSGLGLAS